MSHGDFFEDLLKAAGSSYRARDEQRYDIAIRKGEYEETLDEMWRNYMINPRQIIEYNKTINMIKTSGCKVFRNSLGNHKIVIT